MKPKLPVPKKGIFIVRFNTEEIFHVYEDGKHNCFSCGCDYRAIKKDLQSEYPKRKIQFIHFI